MKQPLVIVTGAASGIGRATALRFARDGFHVAALDRDVAGLETLRDEAGHDSVSSYECDLGDLASLPTVCDRILAELGTPKALVNNAGIRYYAPISEIPTEAWALSLNVNLVSAATLAKHFIPAMQQAGGGAIVNVASRNAFSSSPLAATYDVSKAGLVGLTRTMAVELGQHGIRANAVCPGVIETPVHAHELADPDFRRNYFRLIPLNRFGSPGEIANVIYFLASDDASFLTGQAIVVDGGQISGQSYSKIFEKNDWVPVNSSQYNENGPAKSDH